MPHVTRRDSLFHFGDFDVDLSDRQLLRNGSRLRLQEQQFRVLALLMEHPGRLITREEFQERLWPADTFVDFEAGLNTAVKKLREVLGDSSTHPHYIETVPRQGYRFIADVAGPEKTRLRPGTLRRLRQGAIAGAILLVAALTLILHSHGTPALTEKDSILLADFTNATGDPVFDLTLRQGLVIQLEQSPFLSMLPEGRVSEALAYMGRPSGERLTGSTAREVCARCGGKALVEGSIARLDSHLVLTLNAVSCAEGDSLAREQVEVDRKERVLQALGAMSSRLRHKLGESLPSIQTSDVPLEQATTSSLEALRAYSRGMALMNREPQTEAISYFLRAVEIDPTFATAYAALSSAYGNLGARNGNDYAVKAYELRGRVSERERLYIEARYYDNATGELGKTIETYQRWIKAYPRDISPHTQIAFRYLNTGEFEKAVAEGLEGIRRDPLPPQRYWAAISGHLALGRTDAARALADEAIKNKRDNAITRNLRYLIGFVERDSEAMRQQVEWARGRLTEHDMVAQEARSAAFFGRLKEARTMLRRAIEMAERNDLPGTAAGHRATQAMIEASFGNDRQARSLARAARSKSHVGLVLLPVALSLARIGDQAEAEALADELHQGHPRGTSLHAVWLPVIRAEMEIRRGHPARAIENLESVFRYELALAPAFPPGCVAVDARGRALLALGDGAAAAREFQKIIDHRGLVPNHPVWVLAHLGLARAQALAGDVAGSRKAYEEFFALWKDADPDIPVLRYARLEYARLP